MPKFHVHCRRLTSQSVVLEVNAVSERHARQKVENSDNPEHEFEPIGFDEGMSDLTVEGVTRTQDEVG